MDGIVTVVREQLYGLFAFIPALLKALVIFLIGYIIAKVLYQIIRRAVRAAGLDRLTERLLNIDLLKNLELDISLSGLLAATVYYFVLLVFVMAAVEALGMEQLSETMARLVAYLPNALTALIILLGGIYLADVIKRLVGNTCRSLGIASANLIANAVFFFILLNIVLVALRQAQLQTDFMENNISILLAGIAGAFAIGYGMASHTVIGNILSAFYNRDRIRIGDEITIDGKRGEVVRLGHMSMTLRSENGDYTIPFNRLSTKGFETHARRETGQDALPPEAAE